MRRKNTTSAMMQDYIIESLMLLMDKKDYKDISIGEITAKAGVNRSTYYRHFKSKEDIIKLFFTNIMDNYLKQTTPDMEMKTYLTGMFQAFLAEKPKIMTIHRQKLSSILFSALNHCFTQRNSSQIQFDFSDQFALYYHIGGIFSSFMLWFANDMKPSPEKFAELAVQIQTKPIKPMLL